MKETNALASLRNVAALAKKPNGALTRELQATFNVKFKCDNHCKLNGLYHLEFDARFMEMAKSYQIPQPPKLVDVALEPVALEMKDPKAAKARTAMLARMLVSPNDVYVE